MTTVRVNAKKPYEVHIGNGLLDRLGERLARVCSGESVALISDETVDALYGARAEESLKRAGKRVVRFAFAPGESSKTLTTYGKLLDFLAENQLTRADAVVALGGGVTGDLAGFAAATYLRGIAVAQVPTSLLAMVDSSLGGKTGIDLASGKNLAGAFHQPCLVLTDPALLDTLPQAQWAEGSAEIIKHGVLQSEALFDKMARGELAAEREAIIAENVRIKAAYVSADERDRAARQQLNLGHTMGHPIELLSGYRVPHGQAVAMGMVMAARMAAAKGLCDGSVPQRIAKCLENCHLPTRAPYSARELAGVALRDKKRSGERITLVLPRKIGLCELVTIPVGELEGWMALGVDA